MGCFKVLPAAGALSATSAKAGEPVTRPQNRQWSPFGCLVYAGQVEAGKRRIAVAGILVLAAGARLWDLQNYPPGLYPDQAANGEDALAILRGNLQVFSPHNNGRESLFFYVQALTVGFFGNGTWPLFLASALVGIATVVAAYVAGARLFGSGVALTAAFFLATNPWHVTLSRTGFRAVMVPLLLALALAFIARVLKPAHGRVRTRDAVLAGICVGLGLYTYTAFRAFVVFLILSGVLALLRAVVRPTFRARARELVRPVTLAVVVATSVSLPLLAFFAQNPEFIGVRSKHVSIFNPELNEGAPLRTFVRVSGRTLRAFLVDGDGSPRHNVPLPSLPYHPGGRHDYQGGGAAFLSPLPALLAVLGAGVAVRRAPWLLLLFAVMLLPAVTTAEGIPHGLRTVGAIPAHAWLAGLGGSWLWRWAMARPWTSVRVAGAVFAVVLLVFTALTDLTLYFGLARDSPLAHYEYRGDLSEVSDYLIQKSPVQGQQSVNRLPFLVLDDFSAQTVHFLAAPGYAYRLLKPEKAHLQTLAAREEMIFTQSTLPDASRYLERHPDVQVVADRANRFGETIMLVLALRAEKR